MINHIDKGLNLKRDFLIESINNVFKDEGIDSTIRDEYKDTEPPFVWNIYADYFGYGYFIVECVHIMTDLETGPYFEWFILKKDHSNVIVADTPRFHFKSTFCTFAEVVEEIKNLEAGEADYYDREGKEYYRQRDWEQECFDREHFGGGRSRDENDEFNDMMDDFEAWGNID